MPKKVLTTVLMALFTAVSVVSVYLIHFPLLPSAPFLEYDMADVTVLLSALLLWPGAGILVLLTSCILQALTVSAASGWIGFLMHFCASSVLVLIPSVLFRKKKSTFSLALFLLLGALGMTVVMIPLNLVFTGIFMGTGIKAVSSMLIPAIIPFNLMKAGINALLTFIIYKPVKKIFDSVILKMQ